MPHHRYLVFLLCCLSLSCSNRRDNAFRDQFRWLSGKWEGKNDNTRLVEHWRWNKYRFEGFGYEITNGDTTFSEKLFLEDYAGTPGYVAVVPRQGPTLFSGQAEAKNQWLFINAEHDFPSRIRYVLESDTTLRISLMTREEPNRAVLSYQLKRTR